MTSDRRGRRTRVSLLASLVALVLALVAGGAHQPATAERGAEANKDLARRFYAAINGGDLAALDGLVAADYQSHPPTPGAPPGIEGLRATLDLFAAAFPDLQLTVEDVIAEGDRVVARWTARGTHAGPFFGVPPTDRPVQFGGTDIFRVAGGKLVEAWHIEDLLSILIQIGAIPPPSPAPA